MVLSDTVPARAIPIPRSLRAPRRVNVSTLLLVLAVLALLATIAIGPTIWDRSPIAHQPGATLQNPSRAHPLGTDQFGRDLLARLMTGARWTLLGAAIVSAGISTIGLLVAAITVSSSRLVDLAICRLIEALMAVPNLVIALALTTILGPSFRNLLIALIAAGWPWYARVYRGLLLREQALLYVEGAIVTGASPARVIVRHIAPNITGPVVVLATANLGFVILNLAALSFLGLGIQPPTPEWGAMISDARLYFQRHPWQMLAPGLCITLAVLLANLAGDALRDRLDPRLRSRSS
jgi:ABC-type dipeptide/oligopeptide/nickel transport system permease subunit